MAAKYWVGDSGNWSDNTNHWSDSSGGSPGAVAPGASDDCIFDANSFTTTDTVTVNTTVTIQSMDWSTASLTPTLARSSGEIHVTGNVTFKTGVTVAPLAFDFSTPSGQTSLLDMNGAIMNGTGQWTISLADATSILKLASDYENQGASGVTISNGTFDTDGYAFTAASLVATAGETVYLRSSIVTLRALDGGAINIDPATNFDAGTSTIRFDIQGSQLTLGQQTYNRIEILGGTLASPVDFIDQGYTIDYLYIKPGEQVAFEPSATISNITTLEAVGTASSIITITYKTPGTAGTYALCITNSIVDYVDVEYMDASCGNPVVNPSGTDSGNNTNIIFANWWLGIPGAHDAKPQMDKIQDHKPFMRSVLQSKPQLDRIISHKPSLS